MKTNEKIPNIWIWEPSKETITVEEAFETGYLSMRETKLGRLNASCYTSIDGRNKYIANYQLHYGGTDKMRALAQCFWDFGNRVKNGDIVLACGKGADSKSYSVYGWGIVVEEYDFYDEEYAHSISVDWNKISETNLNIKYYRKYFFKKLLLEEIKCVKTIINTNF